MWCYSYNPKGGFVLGASSMLTALGVILTIAGGLLLLSGSPAWGIALIALSWYVIGKADRYDEARMFGWLFLFSLIAIALGGVLTE